MKKNIIITLLAAATLTSCGEYNKLLKSTDYEYKYEAAKNYFAKGQYNRSATLLNELITILKGTDKAEESLYMLGMSYYNQKDYQTAAQTFITYFNTYPLLFSSLVPLRIRRQWKPRLLPGIPWSGY